MPDWLTALLAVLSVTEVIALAYIGVNAKRTGDGIEKANGHLAASVQALMERQQ